MLFLPAVGWWLVCAQADTFEVCASVQVRNERTGQACYVSSFEFLEQHSIFKDEVNPRLRPRFPASPCSLGTYCRPVECHRSTG